VVVTVLDQCLAVYPPLEWQRLLDQLRSLPAFGKRAKAVTRLLTSRAADCVLDVQGRMLLPTVLREATGLGREAVVVGVLDRFEIWSPLAWEAFLRESERLLDDASLDLAWPTLPADPAPVRPADPENPTRPQGKPNR
jgi:MraZ protein